MIARVNSSGDVRTLCFASGMLARMGGRGKVGLLLSSSATALLIGGGAPAAFAACANNINASFDNPVAATTPCVAVTNTSFTGNITNESTIAPGGITFNHGTI